MYYHEYMNKKSKKMDIDALAVMVAKGFENTATKSDFTKLETNITKLEKGIVQLDTGQDEIKMRLDSVVSF